MVQTIHRRQLAATATLAAIVLVVTVVIALSLGGSAGNAHTVNESGRQRMLSQRIALEAYRGAAAPTAEERRKSLTGMQEAVHTMRASAMALDETASPAAQGVYRSATYRGFERTIAYLDRAQAVHDALLAGDPGGLDRARDLGREAAELLPVLHMVTTADEAYARRYMESIGAAVLVAGALVLGALVGVWFFVFQPVVRVMATEQEELRAAEAARDLESARQAFGASLSRAVEMAEDEPALLATVERAFGSVDPDLPVEMLLADSSQAHLRAAAVHPTAPCAGCTVPSPSACPAVRGGRTTHFASSTNLDACPHLLRDATSPRGALCVPVSFMGRAIGVVHVELEDDTRPDPEAVQRIEQIATTVASRVSTIRTFRQVQLQATTDPLTGLLNRRALEEGVRQLVREERTFAVAIADLDHFKRLNDTHGHDAGDRALGTFAKVCKDSVRDGDLVARFGGEEFVMVFADVGAEMAADILERLRGHLARVVAGSDTPTFTASFGVSDSRLGPSLDMLVQVADAALLRAKDTGRDKVLVADMGGDSPAREAERPTSPDAGNQAAV